MSTFVLKIKTDNAAFHQDDYGHELARILREAAVHLESGGAVDPPQKIRDINGNLVGDFGLGS